MTQYSYNQTIEYIDGTRDLNFEAARKWAQENGATFEEDIEARVTVGGVLKRYFVIGAEPEKPEPTVAEKNEQIRQQRQSRFRIEADPLKLDYDEAVARNENAEQARIAWLAKKDLIRSELPYIEE